MIIHIAFSTFHYHDLTIHASNKTNLFEKRLRFKIFKPFLASIKYYFKAFPKSLDK